MNVDVIANQLLVKMAGPDFRYLELRSGKQPKTCEHRNRSRLLCKIPFDANGEINNGHGLVMEAGTIGHFRIVGKRRKVMMQGDVGTTKRSAFRMDHVRVEAGQDIWVTQFKINFDN